MSTYHKLTFQFQYGTIGRPLYKLNHEPQSSFQFQYGTIGSHRYSLPDSGHLCSFNSSMVRLVGMKTASSFFFVGFFQFQYGTIGRFRILKAIATPIINFQFQYGTIGSKNRCAKAQEDKTFNSSMVRLVGVFVFDEEIEEIANFQFQYGTIGRFPATISMLPAMKLSIPVWYDW